jgi:hypothetical protein
MNDEPDAYQTYLLRLWRVRCQGKWQGAAALGGQWNASLERPHTGERHVFASLQELFAYLSKLCSSQVPHMPGTCPEGQSPSGRRAPDVGARFGATPVL